MQIKLLFFLLLFTFVSPTFSEELEGACNPAVGEIQLRGVLTPQVSVRLRQIYDEDQAMRLEPISEIDQLEVAETSRQHRQEVLTFLLQGKLGSAVDFSRAALVMQHGTCTDHYELAHRLAERAIDMGYDTDETRFLYAATLDRYLISLGKPQKYGTQYRRVQEGEACSYELSPVDSSITDKERIEFGLPPLEAAKKNAEAFSIYCEFPSDQE